MQPEQPKNPLHGITLEQLLNELVAHYGWPALGREIDIRCFTQDPSITSSLKFLRKTPWARQRVESLYIEMLKREMQKRGMQKRGMQKRGMPLGQKRAMLQK